MPKPLDAIRKTYPDAVTFKFGDNQHLSDELIALVRQGKKTATTGALRDYETGDDMPLIGRCDIALNWNDEPELVIQTKELVTCRIDEVTEAMALAEGENDDLDGWRRDHQRYFERNGGYSPDMMVVWERFAVIEDLRS